MKRINSHRRCVLAILSFCFLFATAGCEREVAAELAAISGSCLGDVVAVAVTSYLQDALGVEAPDDEDTHSHDAEPMHDHEH